MAEVVVVHSVEELERYCHTLISLKAEIEDKSNQLKQLSEKLQDVAGHIIGATDQQESNWQDPQYYTLKERLVPVVCAVNATSADAENTARIVKKQSADIDDSINYIKRLISHLRETV